MSDIEVPITLLEVALEVAEAGKLRTCPTCKSVGSTPGLASSSCCSVIPAAAAIASSVSPDTTVYAPATAVVVEFACLGLSREEEGAQTGTASAFNGPEIMQAASAMTRAPECTYAEAKEVLARRPRRNVGFILCNRVSLTVQKIEGVEFSM
jgi:hypothetical protein